MARSLQPGAAVLLRSVYRERVRWAVPHRYVGTDGGRLVLYRAPRARRKDDFAEALELGVLDAAEAAAVRAEGEAVIAKRPWPTGWEAWTPPSEWEPLPLPAGWATVGLGTG
jgi:hypothetical protein